MLLWSLTFGFCSFSASAAPARPNILWITCEDSSPHLGCYGDPLANTPNLDAFARQSVRFLNAFAYTGVCAPSRSCLITGVFPMRLGSHHMRSTTRLPDVVKCFPEYLRAEGYYCSNNVKTDYNFAVPKNAWDESSNQAHWRKRAAGQPFFSVFNFTISHQSQIFGADEAARKKGEPPPPTVHDQSKVKVPPIHPDIPEFRREWARHFDNVTKMDALAGGVLKQLEQDGLAEDTIVFFFSDHGTGMPSVKNWAWDFSLRVPFMVRFPKKWQHLAPAPPGQISDRLVSFVDFAPTVLSLCGVKPPAHLQGVAFLGEHAGAPRQYIYGGSDRHGERWDTIRYVHDGRFHYLRNFLPHLIYGQFFSYVDQHASMRAWQKLHDEGRLTGTPARYFQTKPVEELYDLRNDPWETNNLAADPRHRQELERLRQECTDWMQRIGDLGPEYEMHRRAAGSTPYEIATNAKQNPLKELLAAADIANRRDPKNIPQLERLLANDDAALRWWGAIGLVALKEKAAPAESAVRKALQDASFEVRIAAAEALANLGQDAEALVVLKEALQHDSALVRLQSLNVIDRLGARARSLLPDVAKATLRDPAHKDASDYVARMVGYLPERIGK
ncbi:MAG: sulfatase-like hydrolase/transferase [Verrucomicrobiota bacterium]